MWVDQSVAFIRCVGQAIEFAVQLQANFFLGFRFEVSWYEDLRAVAAKHASERQRQKRAVPAPELNARRSRERKRRDRPTAASGEIYHALFRNTGWSHRAVCLNRDRGAFFGDQSFERAEGRGAAA